ncbi:MAG: DUF3488 domain-containing protein [Planctomycetes bacterium]|nr:DUF3488 domain-containing protein [Planctomycetota bacterium]
MPDRIRKGPSALLLCMMGIVACNVRFVQLTGAADPLWLAPLYVVTLAAPFLVRFREHVVYRGVWNLAIVLVFLRLVLHASTAELAFVLDDGLMLALLCQVHVLNNLRREQRPDLLFLNSYLIAVITGYITVDLSFAFTFLVYAPLFVVGLHLQNLDPFHTGRHALAVRAAWRESLRRSALLVGVTLLAFFFFPRDFNRPALFASYFDFEGDASTYEVGFSPRLEFGGIEQQALQSDRLVMRVDLVDGEAGSVPRFWRGATLSEPTRSGGWEPAEADLPASSVVRDPDWESRWQGLRLIRSGGAEAWTGEVRDVTRVRVTRAGGAEQRLFLPREAFSVELDPIHTAGELLVGADGTAAYSNPGELRFELQLGREPRDPAPRAPSALELAPFIEQPVSLYNQSARTLARELSRRVPEGAGAVEVASEFAAYLASRYPYRVPGAEGAARTLDEFLGTDAGGHCELFASALATMLRSRTIPARVVSGYVLARPLPGERSMAIRARDAHAWVEVYSAEKGGWFPVDPTPQQVLSGAGGGWLTGTVAALEERWATLTSFDAGSRSRFLQSLVSLPGSLLRGAENHLGPLSGLVLLLVLLILRARAARPGPPATVIAMSRAFDRAGLRLGPHETPREGLQRAHASEVDPEQLEALGAAVHAHERDRYAGVGAAQGG